MVAHAQKQDFHRPFGMKRKVLPSTETDRHNFQQLVVRGDWWWGTPASLCVEPLHSVTYSDVQIVRYCELENCYGSSKAIV